MSRFGGLREWLDHWCRRRGMSLTDFAGAVGVKRQTVYVWIWNNRVPAGRVSDVAAVLDLPQTQVDWLVKLLLED